MTIWKTESAFWNWLRGGLRRAVWKTHPVKLSFMKSNRYKAPIGRGGNEVWAVECAMCKKEVRQSNAQVDHIKPAGSLKCKEDIQPFVEGLAFVEEKDLQWLCKPCHSCKSYAERYGVSLAEAKKRKAEIAKKKRK